MVLERYDIVLCDIYLCAYKILYNNQFTDVDIFSRIHEQNTHFMPCTAEISLKDKRILLICKNLLKVTIVLTSVDGILK